MNKQLILDNIERELYLNRRKEENIRYRTEKKRSNKTGYTGVSYNKYRNKYMARIGIKDKKITLGYYDTAEEASEVYKEAVKERDKI